MAEMFGSISAKAENSCLLSLKGAFVFNIAFKYKYI